MPNKWVRVAVVVLFGLPLAVAVGRMAFRESGITAGLLMAAISGLLLGLAATWIGEKKSVPTKDVTKFRAVTIKEGTRPYDVYQKYYTSSVELDLSDLLYVWYRPKAYGLDNGSLSMLWRDPSLGTFRIFVYGYEKYPYEGYREHEGDLGLRMFDVEASEPLSVTASFLVYGWPN
jgi:hypothetical protein